MRRSLLSLLFLFATLPLATAGATSMEQASARLSIESETQKESRPLRSETLG